MNIIEQNNGFRMNVSQCIQVHEDRLKNYIIILLLHFNIFNSNNIYPTIKTKNIVKFEQRNR